MYDAQFKVKNEPLLAKPNLPFTGFYYRPVVGTAQESLGYSYLKFRNDGSFFIAFMGVSPAQFANDPNHDAYTDNWTGLPYVDQAYRSTSRALRKNLFGYLKARTEIGEVKLQAAGYYHRMRGRGDFAPPYLVDARNDGVGNPESEYVGGP
ncbi:MAG: hypothetical protein EOO60_08990, partial [Hymenobacter sp.]